MLLFIADLHLSAERPATLELFRRFLAERADGAEALYILGDLFEAWLGDDLPPPGCEAALDALRELSAGGTAVHAMHGNRDFLLGEGFAARCGCDLLPDPSLFEVGGRRLLLMHGDTLCTDDREYQRLRATLRAPGWMADFLAKPPEQRLAIARQLRAQSSEAVASKAYALMDVNPGAVAKAFREYRPDLLIHGHTHRPAVHHLEVDGRPVTRLVLGDWHDHAKIAVCDHAGCRLETYR